MTSISDLIALVSDIHQLTEGSSHEETLDSRNRSGGKEVIRRVVGKVLASVLPVLESFHNEGVFHDSDDIGSYLENLKNDLQTLQKVVVTKANQLPENYIVYLIMEAGSSHQELEDCLKNIRSALGNMYVHNDTRNNDEETSEHPQVNTIFVRQWEKCDLERKTLRRKELQERHLFLQGSEDVVAHVLAVMDAKELEQANEILMESYSEREDILRKIIPALEHAKRIQQHQDLGHPDIPEWAMCSITGEVMRDPVTVDCPSYHSFERHAIEEWMISRRNNTCPLDREPFESLEVISNDLLRDAIASTVHPELLLPSTADKEGSNSLNSNNGNDASNENHHPEVTVTPTRIYRAQLRRYGPWFCIMGAAILGTGITLIVLAKQGKNTFVGMAWSGCLLFWVGLGVAFMPFLCPPRVVNCILECCHCHCRCHCRLWPTAAVAVLPTMNDDPEQGNNRLPNATTNDATSSARSLCFWLFMGLFAVSIGAFLRLGLLVSCDNDNDNDNDDDDEENTKDCRKADNAIQAGTYVLHIVGFFIILIPLGCLR